MNFTLITRLDFTPNVERDWLKQVPTGRGGQAGKYSVSETSCPIYMPIRKYMPKCLIVNTYPSNNIETDNLLQSRRH